MYIYMYHNKRDHPLHHPRLHLHPGVENSVRYVGMIYHNAYLVIGANNASDCDHESVTAVEDTPLRYTIAHTTTVELLIQLAMIVIMLALVRGHPVIRGRLSEFAWASVGVFPKHPARIPQRALQLRLP